MPRLSTFIVIAALCGCHALLPLDPHTDAVQEDAARVEIGSGDGPGLTDASHLDARDASGDSGLSLVDGTNPLDGPAVPDTQRGDASQSHGDTSPPAWSPIWGKSFGGGSTEEVRDIAVDAAGNIYVTGWFQSSASLGGPALPYVGGFDIFVASYDKNGTHRWSKSFGGPGMDKGLGIAVDSAGAQVFVTGEFRDLAYLGFTKKLKSTGQTDLFLLTLDAKLGTPLWVKTFGGADYERGWDLALDSQGNPTLIGEFRGSLNFGAGVLPSAGDFDVVVARFTPGGAHIKSWRAGGAGSDRGRAIALDSADNIYVCGELVGTVDFGGGPLQAKGQSDVFLVSYTKNGAHRWSWALGGSSVDQGHSLAVDAADNIYLTGHFYGPGNFGGKALSIGGKDIVAASYTSLGAHRWSVALGGAQGDEGAAVAVAGSKVVFVGGKSPPGFMTPMHVFFTGLTNGGKLLWTSDHGAGGQDYATAAVVTGGHIIVAGYFQNTIEFGGTKLTSMGHFDMFLLKLAP